MTVEEAEKAGFCLVSVNEREFRMSGQMYMMHQTYHEFDDTGKIVRYGVLCRDVKDSVLDIEPKFLDMAQLTYQEAKYKPFKSKMSIKEIYALGGKAVSYEGRCVRIRRIGKEYDGSNNWRYVLTLQEVVPPKLVFEAECFEIEPWEGEEPVPDIKEEAPIVARYREMKEQERREQERISNIQGQTMEILRELAAKVG